MKSNTTRRSAPKMRSRLRRPTSKSTTTTFSPLRASVAPSAAVEVVLPTPPLPDVTTMTLAIFVSPNRSIKRCNVYDVTFEPDLRRPVAQPGVDLFSSSIVTVDGQKLGFDFLTIDARGRVAVDARHGAAAQRSVDMDRAAGDDFGPGTHRAHHRHIAIGEHDRLAGAHLAVEQERCRFRLGFALLRFARGNHAVAAAGEQRRQARGEARGVHAL